MKTSAEFAARLKILAAAVPAETELFAHVQMRRSIGWSDGKPSLNACSDEEGLCVRVLKAGKQGIVTARTLEPANIQQLVFDSAFVAKSTPADPFRSFANASPDVSQLPVDSDLFARPLTSVRECLEDLERKVLQHDKRIKKVIKFQFSEGRSLKGIAGSRKNPIVSEQSETSFSAEVLAVEGNANEVAWDHRSKRFSKNLMLDEMAMSVAEHAVESLGGRPVPSGAYTVAVHPRVGVQILSLLAGALSAEAVQRNRSFLVNKRQQKIAASIVNLVDDPLLPDGVASAEFDDEGTPHKRVAVLSEGVLNDYFYDVASANKENRTSNGHGIKQSLGSAPRPSATNFYMGAGPSTTEEMLTAEKKIFFLKDVMGLHMADPITGEFSLGASGSLYENGRRVQPVRGVTIAGTVLDVLKNIGAIGKEVVWYGSIGCPMFLLPNVVIAGT